VNDQLHVPAEFKPEKRARPDAVAKKKKITIAIR